MACLPVVAAFAPRARVDQAADGEGQVAPPPPLPFADGAIKIGEGGKVGRVCLSPYPTLTPPSSPEAEASVCRDSTAARIFLLEVLPESHLSLSLFVQRERALRSVLG